MKKKIWAAVLAAAVAVVSAVPAPYMSMQTVTAAKRPTSGSSSGSSSAAEVEETSTDGRTTANGFVYSVVGTEAVITGYNGTSKDLSIPTKITYTKKETVNVPVTTTSGSSVVITGTEPSETETKTEYSVTSIADNAFSGYLGIQSVTMSGGTDSNGRSYGMKTIGERAFFACQDLTKVTIAGTTVSIGDYAFADCVALNSITVSDGNQKYKVIDGSLYSYSTSSGTGAYTLEQYLLGNAADTYTVPAAISETLTAVGEGAFWGSVNLETVTLPATVETIGESAFAECRKLKSIEMPQGLNNIGADAFKGDVALTEITLPEEVKAINSGMFQGCEALEAVHMPDSLAMIGSYAFRGCKSLTEFVVPAGVTMIGDQAFAECESLHRISIPMRTTSIGSSVFRGTTVTVLCHNGSQAAIYAANNGFSVERTFTVSFYSNALYSTVLSAQDVAEGKDAAPPQMPEREGYQMSWSGDYTNVTQDLRLYPVWTPIYEVTFADSYNDRSEVVQVVEGQTPAAPDWTMEDYTLSWDRDLSEAVTGSFTVNAVWKDASTGQDLDPDAAKPEKKGTELIDGNNRYVVNSEDSENPTVKFTGLVRSRVSKVTVPGSITVNEVTYEVTAVSANALNGNANVTTLVLNKNITSISAKAFYSCARLKTIKLKAKSITKMNSRAFGKIDIKAVFYTYNSQISKYKSMLKKAGVKKPTMKRL